MRKECQTPIIFIIRNDTILIFFETATYDNLLHIYVNTQEYLKSHHNEMHSKKIHPVLCCLVSYTNEIHILVSWKFQDNNAAFYTSVQEYDKYLILFAEKS